MKILNSVCLTLLLAAVVISSVNAAKENFQRTKPHFSVGNGLDNDCDGDTLKEVCKKTSSRAQDHNSTRSNRATMKDRGDNDLVLRKKPGRTIRSANDRCQKKSGRCTKSIIGNMR